jgi:hypothetical protein
MSSIQTKPIEEVFTSEPQFQPLGSQGKNSTEPARIKYLRVALQLVGVTFIFGIYTLTIVWPSGWSWHTGHTPHYLQMILSVYATLGIFLLIASRKPVAHAAVMAVQSLANPEHTGHLWGDVLALFLVATVLAFLTPRTE